MRYTESHSEQGGRQRCQLAVELEHASSTCDVTASVYRWQVLRPETCR